MFNQKHYKEKKREVERNLRLKIKTNYDYLEAFKIAILLEDYEYAKAIDECLAEAGVDVKETHKYIETIK
jgi:hypothetical protein